MPTDTLRELTADSIPWTDAPLPRPDARPILSLVAELLPTVGDDLLVDLLDFLAISLADRTDELAAERTLRSVALNELQAQRMENLRLKQRLANSLDAQRRARAV
jgi:hypothetical protein